MSERAMASSLFNSVDDLAHALLRAGATGGDRPKQCIELSRREAGCQGFRKKTSDMSRMQSFSACLVEGDLFEARPICLDSKTAFTREPKHLVNEFFFVHSTLLSPSVEILA
ncbi:hypothetical protein AWB76_06273 [Caballeronia temeraria]|uniref:Uncharacterized protein n=1 Tax=Caballeronia temeraria TaxID=1777137 RepID=A0A158D088_9BURK|nr:hypothetical protein AWB76_06273 [Caballeronia temeraria]